MTVRKTHIENKLRRKKNPFLVQTLLHAKKKAGWDVVAHIAALPRRKKIEKNLDEIDGISQEGDTIVIPGKVLGRGNVEKKIRICAIAFSQEAKRKLKEKKCEIVSIEEEIQINPKYQGIKIFR